MMAKQPRALGFTLIELMIAVAIVAILAAIAYPSFQDSIRRSRRADGKAALMTLQQNQEKLRATCATYGANLGSANDCATSTVAGSATSTDGYYTITVGGTGATTYTLTATATSLNGQNKDTGCTALTLSRNGATDSKSPASCW